MSELMEMRGYYEFDPTAIGTFILTNKYRDLEEVKIRLKGASDPTINLAFGDKIEFSFGKNDGHFYAFHNGKVVQQIDLNDGSSGLDLTFPYYGRNTKNQLEYHGRGENAPTQSTTNAVMDFDTNVYNCDIVDSAGLGGVSPMRVGSHCSDDGKTFFVTLTRR